MSVHDPLTLERWRTIFATRRSSGLSVAEFCRSRSLNTSSFYRWRKILDDLDQTPDSRPPQSFVPVRMVPDTIVELILTGLQLRVPLTADAGRVARSVRAGLANLSGVLKSFEGVGLPSTSSTGRFGGAILAPSGLRRCRRPNACPSL